MQSTMLKSAKMIIEETNSMEKWSEYIDTIQDKKSIDYEYALFILNSAGLYSPITWLKAQWEYNRVIREREFGFTYIYDTFINKIKSKFYNYIPSWESNSFMKSRIEREDFTYAELIMWLYLYPILVLIDTVRETDVDTDLQIKHSPNVHYVEKLPNLDEITDEQDAVSVILAFCAIRYDKNDNTNYYEYFAQVFDKFKMRDTEELIKRIDNAVYNYEKSYTT